MDPGEYLHIGFEMALIKILNKIPPNFIPHVLKVDWSTDSATLYRSGYMQLWPLQCSIVNITDSKPEIVGVYKGRKEPNSVDLFLDKFINDVLQVINNGGILFLNKLSQ